MVDLIARQNQHQETLFRGLTAGEDHVRHRIVAAQHLPELTSEIRGERMRFVDAMKEATEINVQCMWTKRSNAIAENVPSPCRRFQEGTEARSPRNDEGSWTIIQGKANYGEPDCGVARISYKTETRHSGESTKQLVEQCIHI